MGLGKHIYGAINILPDSGKKSVWSATSYTERDKLSERRGGDGVESTISVCRKRTSYHLKLRFFCFPSQNPSLSPDTFQSQWGRVEVPQFGFEIENYEKNRIFRKAKISTFPLFFTNGIKCIEVAKRYVIQYSYSKLRQTSHEKNIRTCKNEVKNWVSHLKFLDDSRRWFWAR